jgi:predicted nucleic acid-binding protein
VRSRSLRPYLFLAFCLSDALIAGTAALHDAELVTCDAEFAAFPSSLRLALLLQADH